jgi:hypothetical protein
MLGDLLYEPMRLRFPCDATKEPYERWLFDWVTNSTKPSEHPAELRPWLNCAEGSERCAPHQSYFHTERGARPKHIFELEISAGTLPTRWSQSILVLHFDEFACVQSRARSLAAPIPSA